MRDVPIHSDPTIVYLPKKHSASSALALGPSAKQPTWASLWGCCVMMMDSSRLCRTIFGRFAMYIEMITRTKAWLRMVDREVFMCILSSIEHFLYVITFHGL
jgi:hypothetical protein